MEKFFKRKASPNEQGSSSNEQGISSQQHVQFNLEELPPDPGKRPKISTYHPNHQEIIRRTYLQRGPCQPMQHNFPQRKFGNSMRRFCSSWYSEFGNWLEYSIEKDAAFCLCCYLFKPDIGKQSGGDTFVIEGFTNWNKKNKLSLHVGGGPNCAHNIAWKKCEDLMKQNQHIEVMISKQSDVARNLYRIRLTASLDCLSTSRIRGQGYDGASNMQGHISGLKSLILRESPSAFYVHCFAHQLQLTLVAIAKGHLQVCSLFGLVSDLINVVRGSCKRNDMLHESQEIRIRDALENGEIVNGRGLNQETNLKRPADTRWSSHYATLVNLILMYSSVTDVLEILKEDESTEDKARSDANGLSILMASYDFALTLHLMKNVLGISNELSQALQKKDQDILNAMNLVNITKERLQTLRDDGWQPLLEEVTLFCNKHEIKIPNMDDIYFRGKSKRGGNAESITIEHHYRIELFYTVVDMQLQALNNRFNETNSRLLICMTCLCPTNLFSAFDKAKLIEFAKFYPSEFCSTSLVMLDNQLETYIIDMRRSVEFASLKGISDLSEKLVETKRHIVYPLVYQLLKLAMILPVATATVERSFSAMKIVKTRLRNRMGDEWLNDCLVIYVERDVLDNVDDELIIQQFQNMSPRSGQL